VLGLQGIVDEGSMHFIASGDVDGFAKSFTEPLFRCPSIYHDGWPIVASKGHDNARHVLVTARNGNAGVVVLGTGDRLD